MATEKKDDGGPAFPVPIELDPSNREIRDAGECGLGGMSLRDYFAAAALRAILACPSQGLSIPEDCAMAYRYADAMLAARKEGL